MARGQIAEGDRQYRNAQLLEPDHPDAANNRGVVNNLQGDFAAAEQWCAALCCCVLTIRRPTQSRQCAQGSRALGEAISAYEQAIQQGGSPIIAQSGLGRAGHGRLREGWRLYEERWASHQLQGGVRAFSRPRWNGEAGNGGVLLLHAEQGFGDTLQFCRYARSRPLGVGGRIGSAAAGWFV